MMNLKPVRVALAVLVLAAGWNAAAASELVVDTAAELEAALARAAPGQTIRLLAGEYRFERPLRVPDGVSLAGTGRVALARDGTPAALEPADATTLRAAETLPGDLLTLGDGTTLSGLRVIVPARVVDGEPVPSGNAVVVGSRRGGDRIAAMLSDCEILTESKLGADAEGPTGRGVLLTTRNPVGEAPHEAARLQLVIDRSIVRAPFGNALLANNFASHGVLTLEVRRSLVEGITSISGGTARPDPVSGASTTFRSERTLYRRATPGMDRLGWQLYGASGIPVGPSGRAEPGATLSITRVDSRDDRIEGFRTGVLAAGYRRVADFSGPGHDNRVELRLRNTRILSVGEDAGDLVLLGAIGEVAPRGNLALPPGRGNVTRADLANVRGSGERVNRFVHRAGPADPDGVDDGNRVVIVGRPEAFEQSNADVVPGPPAAIFEAAQ